MRSTVNNLVRSIFAFLIITLLAPLISLSACNDKPGFEIYLADGGELVLSDRHIDGYYWDSHTIELNEEGIEKWNSYIPNGVITKVQQILYQREFVLKIKGKEIYRGTFTGSISSVLFWGVVITDTAIRLDENRNIIKIGYANPEPSQDNGEDPRNNRDVFDYLESKGLLK